MELTHILYQYFFLPLHIASGSIALLAGLVAIVAKKGARLHRLSGKVYFYAMCGVAASAFYLSVYKHIPFLFNIGVMSFYFTYTGFRSVKNKKAIPGTMDKLVLFANLLASTVQLYMGFSGGGVLPLFFGALGGFIGVQDAKIYFFKAQDAPVNKKLWLIRHIGRMSGAYISTLTAFLVVNLRDVPVHSYVVWIAPTIIGVPLIVMTVRRHIGRKSVATISLQTFPNNRDRL
jgi:uncharacterized membrane protein